jgi:hypothetical protein
MQQNILEIALKIFKKKLEEWPKSHWNKLNDFMKKNIHFNKKKINSQEKKTLKKSYTDSKQTINFFKIVNGINKSHQQFLFNEQNKLY